MDKPQVLGSSEVYKGKIFDIRVDSIREGDLEYKREIVVHGGSAVILPVFHDMTVGLVRQYRHAVGDFMLELPAGLVEPGEDPRDGAIRELEEEVGVVAASVEKLTEFYVSPGFLTEKMFVYLATELRETAQDLDADELIQIERIPFAEALGMLIDGSIRDAKTMVALLLAAPRFGL
jgi:ADP-ribose pyrophosphatase